MSRDSCLVIWLFGYLVDTNDHPPLDHLIYETTNFSDKREQRKLAYSAERRKGRMKFN